MFSPFKGLEKLLQALSFLVILTQPGGALSSANEDEFQRLPASGKPKPTRSGASDCTEAFRALANQYESSRTNPQPGPSTESPFFIASTSAERTEVLSKLVLSLEASLSHYPSVEPLVLQNIRVSGSSLSDISKNAPARLRALKEQLEKPQGHPNQKEALNWLEKSIEDDLSSTEVLIAAGKYGTGCYHAQQTAEKALKAVLIHFQVADPKAIKKHGHDLVAILATIQKGVADPETVTWVSLTEAVSALTPLATKYRYPDPSVKPPDKDEAQNALELAQIVVNLALSAMTPPRKP